MKNKLGKKLLALILSMSLLFSVVPSTPVFAAGEVYGIVVTGSGKICNCDSNGENVGTTEIEPENVTNLFIASDVEQIFYSNLEIRFENLVSLTIPPTVRVIENTFGNSPKLENIDFSNAIGLEEIRNFAFAGCSSLKTVDLSKATSLKAFKNGANGVASAFQQCVNLETVILPKNLKELGGQTFERCFKLADVTFLSKTPPTTGELTFEHTKDQINFHLPTGSNVNEWEAAFSKSGATNPVFIADNQYGIYKNDGNVYECDENAVATATIADKKAITNLFIAEDVTEIQDSAFFQCSNMVHVDFSNAMNLKTIGVSSFAYCNNLETITNFPQSVTEIHANAFENCRNLESVDLTNATNLISIGNTAFSGCESIKTMVIPDNVTSIGEFVFGTCKNLMSVTLPKDITKIGKSMFIECSKLESIEIPQNVTEIDHYAFYNCNSLSNVRFSTEQPPTFGMNSFQNTKDGINVFLNNGGNEDNWREKLTEAGMTNPNFIIDITPPTAQITVGDAIFTTATDPVTFDTLLKDKAEITITANDPDSEIKKIEYQEVSSEADYNVDGIWKPYTEKFDVNNLGKNIIYVRVTNLAGNQTIINTNGFIIYTDSQLQTEVTEFDRKEENQKDIFVKVNLNGNTLKNITNGETVLKSGTDYIIEDSSLAKNSADYPESSSLILNIQKSYLAKLPNGIQTLNFNFNPCGVEGDLVINTPLEITIKDTGHIHEYDTEFTIERNSTCTEEGEKSRHCKGFALCGDRTDITKIGFAPHTGGVANCHAKAVCSVCNKEYGAKDSRNHDGETELRRIKIATHKEEGYSGDTYCKGCNMPLKLGKVVPKIPHIDNGDWWKHDEKAHWHICTGCDEKLDNAGHTFATQESILASCKDDHERQGEAADLSQFRQAYDITHKNMKFQNPIYFFCTFCNEVKKEEFKINDAVVAIKNGDNLVYALGTIEGATFTSAANINDFLAVSIDGKQLKTEDIKLKSGSTIVTISCEYMDTLSNGKHTVSIYSTTGTATANFTVVGNEEIVTPEKPINPEKPTNPKTPSTGDNGTMLLWISLLFISGGAMTLFGISKKRRKVNEK